MGFFVPFSHKDVRSKKITFADLNHLTMLIVCIVLRVIVGAKKTDFVTFNVSKTKKLFEKQCRRKVA